MSKADERLLLRDLLDLYARYGDAAFRRASELLRNPRALEDALEAVVEAAPQFARRTAGARVRSQAAPRSFPPERRLDEINKELDETAHPLGEEIKKLVREIAEGKALTSDRLMRDFLRTLEPYARITKIDRWLVARRVGRKLVGMPEPEVRKLVELAHRESAASSLQEWSRVIVRG